MKLMRRLQHVGETEEDEPREVGAPRFIKFPTPFARRLYWEMRDHYLREYGRTVH